MTEKVLKDKKDQQTMQQQQKQEPVENPSEVASRWVALANQQKKETLERENKERDAKLALFRKLLEESDDDDG